MTSINKKTQERLKSIFPKKEFNELSQELESLIDLGYEYIEQEDYKKSFNLFSLGFRLDKSNLDIINGLGISLFELGRSSYSKRFFKKALDLYPEDAITLANLAGIFWEEGDYDSAIHFYFRSLKTDPFILETHLNIINLYYDQGDLYMAYIACLNLLDIYPSNDQAIELRDDIIMSMAISI